MDANIELTPQQQSLVDFARAGTGNALVQAVAGSGKTSTLFGVLRVLSGQVLVLAYNKKIEVEFKNKLSEIVDSISASVTVSTFHAAGLRAWRRLHPRVKIDDKKVDKLLEGCPNPHAVPGVPLELRPFVSKAYTLARQWGAGVLPEFTFNHRESWLNLVDHFDLQDEFEDANGVLPKHIDALIKEAINWTVRVIKYGIELAPEMIDFEDMIYMPLRYNIRVWENDFVLVDEAQDINPTRRAFVKKSLKVTGRAFFVGDVHQAIYGFTGADAKSFENIKREFAAQEFPLTWCFRCGKNIISFVKRWVQDIEAAPQNADGELSTINSTELLQQNLSVADAILCRNNAPLCELFFKLLKAGIPAHIEGRDIAAKLLKFVDRYKVTSITALQTRLENYKERQINKAQQQGKEEKSQEVADIVDSIIAISDAVKQLNPAATVADVRKRVQEMFQDSNGEKKPTLTLTSSHKSKGREWSRVFWYGFNRYNPSPYARQQWQIDQENNLCYVSGTRAQQQLVLVNVAVPQK